MSRVTAYICEFKNHLVKEEDAVGINPVEDLFDKQQSFPSEFKLHRTDIHYCVECYAENVLHPAGMQVNRRKNERDYELKVKELGYGFRQTCIHNYRIRKQFRQGGKKVRK